MRALIAVLALSVLGFGSAQPISVQLADESTPDAPVAIAGTVAVNDEIVGEWLKFSYATDLSAVNISSKGVLAVVIKMHVRGINSTGMGSTLRKDYFFLPRGLEPNTEFSIHGTDGPILERRDRVVARRTRSKAVAKVAFIQFIDGSTWGDVDEAQGMLEERSLTQKELEFLEQVYTTSGEERFMAEIMEGPRSSARVYLSDFYSANKDPAAVLAEMRSMLRCADLHYAVRELQISR
jgi:hypothetical protein